MKLMVIGLGQCGSRIADEFVRLNKIAEQQRHTNVITGAFAVNTDQADLTGLSHISSDYMHRILIGGRKTWGHGVGKVNEMGAELAREDGDKVIDAIRTAP
jgi:cell division GTPase FtsZ